MTRNLASSLVKQYMGLESLETMEELASVSNLVIDERVLPVLRRRLDEELRQQPLLEMRGYLRMAEKSAQLITVLKPLIAALEDYEDGTPT
jgi:hypothetical protein